MNISLETYTFYKYQGTGNDFVIIDNRENIFDANNISLVKKLCDRKFGVGADGLMLIENHSKLDFDLIYFNSDGSKSFCGNGSRCGVSFANFLGIIEQKATFNAIDGIHQAKIKDNKVHLKMNNVSTVETIQQDYFLDTGSPHYIIYKKNLGDIDIIEEAHKIRYNERFSKDGTNVNFVQLADNHLKIRTYERGVENETLSCGTGATAVALSAYIKHNFLSPIKIEVQGGELDISFRANLNNTFEDIWLIGEAKQVYKGQIII